MAVARRRRAELGAPPRRRGGHRDRQVARVPRAGRARRSARGGRDGDQGAPGPAARQGGARRCSPRASRSTPRCSRDGRTTCAASASATSSTPPRHSLSFGGDGDEPSGVATQLRRIADLGGDDRDRRARRPRLRGRPAAWGRVSMPADECPGAERCPFGASCFAEEAKRRAERADVVIVNAALYGAHLSTGSTLLPAHEVVVFDEAHELDAQLSRSLGVELSATRLRAIAAHGARQRGRRRALDRRGPPRGPVTGSAALLVDRARTGRAHRARRRDPHRARRRRPRGRAARRGDRASRAPRPATCGAGACAGRPSTCVATSCGCATRPTDDLVFLEGTSAAATLVRAPVDVGPLLQRLWAEVDRGAVQRDDARAASRTGSASTPRTAPASRSRLRSTTATTRSSTCPTDLPDRRDPRVRGRRSPTSSPRSSRRPAAARWRCSRRGARSRTSVAAVRDARGDARCCSKASSSRTRCSRRSWPTRPRASSRRWGSGRASTSRAGRSRWSRSIGSRSAAPTTRCSQARRERAGDAAFCRGRRARARRCSSPRASGRLIRTAEDRGVVCVLDTRLATASYRAPLLRRLPPMRRTTQRDDAVAFLARGDRARPS